MSKELEEGDDCPHRDCPGQMHLPPVRDCACHISPPCVQCMKNELQCRVCLWMNGDPIEDTKTMTPELEALERLKAQCLKEQEVCEVLFANHCAAHRAAENVRSDHIKRIEAEIAKLKEGGK